MNQLRRHPALLLLAAFVVTSVVFIACSGGPYGEGDGDLERGGPVDCVPGSVRRCRGPKKCLGEQVCMRNGKEYGACVCTWRPPPTDASHEGDSHGGDACE